MSSFPGRWIQRSSSHAIRVSPMPSDQRTKPRQVRSPVAPVCLELAGVSSGSAGGLPQGAAADAALYEPVEVGLSWPGRVSDIPGPHALECAVCLERSRGPAPVVESDPDSAEVVRGEVDVGHALSLVFWVLPVAV